MYGNLKNIYWIVLVFSRWSRAAEHCIYTYAQHQLTYS